MCEEKIAENERKYFPSLVDHGDHGHLAPFAWFLTVSWLDLSFISYFLDGLLEINVVTSTNRSESLDEQQLCGHWNWIILNDFPLVSYRRELNSELLAIFKKNIFSKISPPVDAGVSTKRRRSLTKFSNSIHDIDYCFEIRTIWFTTHGFDIQKNKLNFGFIKPKSLSIMQKPLDDQAKVCREQTQTQLQSDDENSREFIFQRNLFELNSRLEIKCCWIGSARFVFL